MDKKIFILGLLIIVLVLGIEVFISPKSQDIRKKAKEKESIGKPVIPEVLDSEKDKYKENELIVKFNNQIPNINLKSDKNINKDNFYLSDINENNIPLILKKIDDKNKIEFISKIFKNIDNSQDELFKLKRIFQEHPAIKRKINEEDFIKNDLSTVYKIVFEKNVPVEDLVKEIKNDNSIDFVEPNYIFHSFFTPNDPYYLDPNPPASERSVAPSSGGWNPIKDDGSLLDYQWGIKKIGMESAWDIVNNNREIVLAIVDTGVDYSHQELGGCSLEQINSGSCDKFVPGYDFVNDDNDPADDNGHGTHLAGIAAAEINNQVGIAGTASKMRLMAVKSGNNEGAFSNENGAQGIIYAAQNGTDIINLSWGGNFSSVPQLTKVALDYAASLGVVLVAAAGNTYFECPGCYPANHPAVIAVSATNYKDEKADFSSYGNYVSLAAPGVNILSLRAKGADLYCPPDCKRHIVGQEYYWADGTSMAAPFVSALAGLILTKYNDIIGGNIDILKNILFNSALDLGQPGFDNYYGYGRIDGYKALSNPNTNPPLTAPLIVKITSPEDEDFFRPEATIPITGIAIAPYFSRYILEYYPEDNPINKKIITISNQPARWERIFTNWITPKQDGVYYVNLTVEYYEGSQLKTSSVSKKIKIDSMLRPGWPVKTQVFRSNIDVCPNNRTYLQSPVIADLDLDGSKEIIVNILGTLKVYSNQGNLIWSRPIWSDFNGIDICSPLLPAVGDIDKNYPGQEIVVYEKSRIGGQEKYGIMAYHADGSEVQGWPFYVYGIDPINREPSVTIVKDLDINRIAFIEFLGIDYPNQIRIINGDGTVHRTIVPDDNSNSLGHIFAGDLNGDKKDELLIKNLEHLEVYDINGNHLKTIFTKEEGERESHIVGDINGDGEKEIIVLAINASSYIVRSAKLYIFSLNHQDQFAAWNPRDITDAFRRIYTGAANFQISLGDLNSDIHPEMIISTQYNSGGNNDLTDLGKYIAIDINGNWLDGLDNSSSIPKLFYTKNMTIGNLDSLSSKIIAGTGLIKTDNQYEALLSLYNYSGSGLDIFTGYPKKLCSNCDRILKNTTLVSLDNITLSVIAIYHYLDKYIISVFDLPYSDPNTFIDWPQYLHDERHTGSYEWGSGYCQCDIKYVTDNRCVNPKIPVCTSKFSCQCQ